MGYHKEINIFDRDLEYAIVTFNVKNPGILPQELLLGVKSYALFKRSTRAQWLASNFGLKVQVQSLQSMSANAIVILGGMLDATNEPQITKGHLRLIKGGKY